MLCIACRRAAVPGITLGKAALNETVGAGFPSETGVQSALLAAQGFPLTAPIFFRVLVVFPEPV